MRLWDVYFLIDANTNQKLRLKPLKGSDILALRSKDKTLMET